MFGNYLLRVTAVFFLLSGVAVSQPNEAVPRTGAFQLTATLEEIADSDRLGSISKLIALDEAITWDVFVPEDYRPESPSGLFVYISPTRSGKIPRMWKPILAKYNIVWMAARRSGNWVDVKRRAAFALVAPTLAAKHFSIDADRVYLSGFSGGGKVAGMIASVYPHVFKGAIYNSGIDSLERNPPQQIELFRLNHYVFVTGTSDTALGETKKAYREYLEAGAANSKLMVIRGMGHRLPQATEFDEALLFLDSRLVNPGAVGQRRE